MSTRRSYSTEFKLEAAGLVVDQGYSVKAASEAIGVGVTAIRRWAAQLSQERDGITPKGSHALTVDQQRIRELEKTVRKLEREKEILKKASALLMSDAYNA